MPRARPGGRGRDQGQLHAADARRATRRTRGRRRGPEPTYLRLAAQPSHDAGEGSAPRPAGPAVPAVPRSDDVVVMVAVPLHRGTRPSHHVSLSLGLCVRISGQARSACGDFCSLRPSSASPVVVDVLCSLLRRAPDDATPGFPVLGAGHGCAIPKDPKVCLLRRDKRPPNQVQYCTT